MSALCLSFSPFCNSGPNVLLHLDINHVNVCGAILAGGVNVKQNVRCQSGRGVLRQAREEV